MIRSVGITGASGLLGWHLRCLLAAVRPGWRVALAERATLLDDELTDGFVDGCDVIVHLAGQNRGPDDEVTLTNVALADRLSASIERTRSICHVVFANSTQRDLDNAYGQSKAAASTRLRACAVATGSAFTDIVFPNVFGECGRPFANSVVSTFCHQIARGGTPEVHVDREMSVLHALEAAQLMIDAIDAGIDGELRPEGSPLTVSALLAMLTTFHGMYVNGEIPAIVTDLERDLFNTYRCFRFEVAPTLALRRHADARGAFFETVRSHHQGQTSFSTTVPGVTRGDHFHLHKVERFVVVSGRARIDIRRLTTAQVMTFEVDGEAPVAIDLPTLHTHNITNVGAGQLLTMFWSDDHFDPAHPDTYAEKVV